MQMLQKMNPLKFMLLLVMITSCRSAFSQVISDFKPVELYNMLDMDPEICVGALKAKDFKYLSAEDDTKVYTANGNHIGMINSASGYGIKKIVYGTMDYSFVSKLRVFLQVGFYRADDKNGEAWTNANGSKMIVLYLKKNDQGDTQYFVAFQNMK